MRYLLFLLAVLFLPVLPSQLNAQDHPVDTVTYWRIITIDGNIYYGSIVREDSTSIQLETETLGTFTIKRKYIKAIDPVNDAAIKEGKLWADNPQAARYFWSPSGYGLKKGEGYYQNIWILFNQVSYGFNDYFSMGLGVVPTFLFGEAATPIWLTPKLSYPIVKDKFNAGGGLLVGTVLGEPDFGGFGIAYGIATLGNRDRHATFGLGYGFADGDWARHPILTLSGMYRISEKGYLMTENFILPDIGLLSLGGRTVWPNVALDYGGVIPVGVNETIIIPWLGMTVTIRK